MTDLSWENIMFAKCAPVTTIYTRVKKSWVKKQKESTLLALSHFLVRLHKALRHQVRQDKPGKADSCCLSDL